ncbi:MAG: DUF4340 domain-containing protein [Phycisphaerales bacterium]|nr:DUF4340 domain-containing protein [Phycisphaerales bacterium]
MPWRTTILTLIISAILAGIAIMSVRSVNMQSSTAASGPLSSDERFPLDLLTRIEFDRDSETWVFVREADGWWQEEPFRVPIEDYHLNALAERTLDLRVVDRFGNEDGLSQESLKLNPARAAIRFVWPDGSRQFELGRRGVAGRGYLRIDGSPDILVVNQGLHDLALDVDPTTWREPRLFPGVDIEAQRISRVVPGEDMVLERNGSSWQFVEPVTTRTDRQAMESYIIDLARARASGVILDNPADLSTFGLHEPLATLEVVENNGTTRTLLVGDRVGGRNQDRYVMLEGIPSVLRLDEKSVAALLADPISLVDPVASGVPRSSIKAIEIHGPIEDIYLERDLDRWIATSHAGVEVPADRVDSLLELLIDIPATDVALVQTYPRELEQGTITLIGYDRRPLDTVRLLREKDSDGGRWGMENGDMIVRIQPAIIDLPLRPQDWGIPAKTSESD